MAISDRQRRRIQHRARGICEYCRSYEGLATAVTRFHVDHITPRYRFKSGDPAAHLDENLAWACWSCNVDKGTQMEGIDPLDGTHHRLFNPRIDHWSEHFKALPSGHIQGRTPVGRATVEALAFNRVEKIETRAWWYEREVWPS